MLRLLGFTTVLIILKYTKSKIQSYRYKIDYIINASYNSPDHYIHRGMNCGYQKLALKFYH
jgi:hypothetical protein